MRIYYIHDSPADAALKVLGYQPIQRCLLLGTADGDPVFSRLVKRKVNHICRQYGACILSPFKVTQKWEHTQFTDPYIREDLMDYGIVIDTLDARLPGINYIRCIRR